MSINQNKFLVEIYNNDLLVKSVEVKTFREINKEIPTLKYHQIRTLYENGKNPTKLHPFLQQYDKLIKIKDIIQEIKINF